MPNLNPLVIGLVEVGAGLVVPLPAALLIGKLVEITISDQKEIQQEISLIHGRINRLEQRINTLEQRVDGIEDRFNQQILQPFRTANAFLERAKNASKKKDRRHFIEQAQQYFIEASVVDVSSSQPISLFFREINRVIPLRAQFYVGVCYDLLGKNKKAHTEYLNIWKLVLRLIHSQDIVYNEWKTVKKSLTILEDYPGTLDNLIDPRLNDKQTMLHRKYSPVSLFGGAKYQGLYIAQFLPPERSTLVRRYGLRFMDPKLRKLSFQESRDAWDLAIGLTNILASRM